MKTFANYTWALLAILLFSTNPDLLANNGLDTVTTIEIPEPITDQTDLTGFLHWYEVLYGAIVILLGFVHNWIPVLTTVTEKWVRVALAGLIVGVIFFAYGFADGLSLVFTFLSAVGIYDIFLKRTGLKSPPIKNLGVLPKKVA